MVRAQSTRTVFQGRVFDVTVERVRLPNGLERDLEVVRHPASVVLIPMPDPGSVVLVRQYRHPVDAWLWELPAGTLEAGEAPEAAARRECEEETGFAPGQLERLGAFFPVPGYCDEQMIFYRLTGLTRPERPALPDEDEDLEVRTFPVEEVRRMVRRGEIADLKSALGLTFV
jgi:ADP-ribose pyrophosphatase